jgi:transposase
MGEKKVVGRKRHILVDTMGCLLYAVVHGADLQDAEGAKIVLENGLDEVPTIRTVFADGGYDRDHLHEYVWSETDVDLEIVKRNEDQTGFQVLPKRWIVERTLAWFSRFRRLAKDYEFLPECSESWLYLASIHLLTKRVAKEMTSQNMVPS